MYASCMYTPYVARELVQVAQMREARTKCREWVLRPATGLKHHTLAHILNV